jgi:hypothetical protein
MNSRMNSKHVYTCKRYENVYIKPSKPVAKPIAKSAAALYLNFKKDIYYEGSSAQSLTTTSS